MPFQLDGVSVLLLVAGVLLLWLLLEEIDK